MTNLTLQVCTACTYGNLLPVEPMEISIVPRYKKYSGDISPTHFQTNHTRSHTDLSDHITATN